MPTKLNRLIFCTERKLKPGECIDSLKSDKDEKLEISIKVQVLPPDRISNKMLRNEAIFFVYDKNSSILRFMMKDSENEDAYPVVFDEKGVGEVTRIGLSGILYLRGIIKS